VVHAWDDLQDRRPALGHEPGVLGSLALAQLTG
jgi:hypothetical protein